MNSAGKARPVVTNAAPAVSSATGLGTGGGAGVAENLGDGWGEINVKAGQGATSGPVLVLKYGTTPMTMTYAHESDLGTLVISGQGTATHTLTFSNAKLTAGAVYRVGYEWGVSK